MLFDRSVAIFNTSDLVSMKIVKIFFRSVLHFFEFLFGFLAFYFCFAVITAIIPVNTGEGATDGIKNFVKSNGIHTDICLPVNNEYIDWTSFIPLSDYPKIDSAVYVSIGWGDKGFFIDTPEWSDLTFSTAFNAALLPSATAMHVSYFKNEPQVSSTCKKTFVRPKKYMDLINFIKTSFNLDKQNKIQLIANKGYWDNDNFYEANGTYHLFKTCNIWTNKALKVAGVRTACYALFSGGIMGHL